MSTALRGLMITTEAVVILLLKGAQASIVINVGDLIQIPAGRTRKCAQSEGHARALGYSDSWT